MEWKQKQLRILNSRQGILHCDADRVDTLNEGKKLLASKKRVAILEEIEMLSFSIAQRTKNISRLAG